MPGDHTSPVVKTPLSVKEILTKSLKSGLSGSAAMVIQVSTLMWMRTIMNYQYRYGGTIKNTFSTLYKDGGPRRFYRGYSVALIQAPVSRFGDTFANTLFLTFMSNNPVTKNLPMMVQTIGASVSAGLFRIILVPIDTVKTILQVEGKQGLTILSDKIKHGGVKVMFFGAIASASATFVGHYPWFATYNFLNARLKTYTDKKRKLLRQAFIGFVSSVISDTCSNSLRVVKTTKQTSSEVMNYAETFRSIVKKDGLKGLFGRGLKMRIMTNGIQGLLFSVLWKMFSDILGK